jgi:glycerophosphoryl diester phosphodiesterase
MQSGGTGFLITASNKGTDITFLPNVSADGKSSWKWAQSGVVPEPGRYYHVVGIWNKQTGKASIYVDGVFKKEVDAAGNLNFPTEGNTWFCVGGDPSGNGAHAGFNGDVVVARIYDDPLTATDVTELYKLVKNDVKSEVISMTDVAYLPSGSVAKGCWYYVYSAGFKNGDALMLESLSGSSKFECETVYVDGCLKLRIPDNFVTGKYRIVAKRGDNVVPVGYADLKLVDSIQQVNRTQIVAHRGYHPGNVPENSLASLVEAQKLGVYGSEFDVYVTLDNEVVLYHNASFSGNEVAGNAQWSGKRPDSCNYTEIKDYKLANGEPIPTLNDYLVQAQKYPNTKLILEIKSHNTAEKNMRAAKTCFEMVKAKNMQHQVEYIAFDYDICKELVRLDPNAMVQYLSGNKAPKSVLADGIRGIDYTYSKLTDAWINEANELGMTVNVWTVNSESQMLDFMNKGVDLITTDESEKAMKLVGKPFISVE